MSEPTIGERIKAIRGDIPQDEFAKKYGLNRNTLGRYEKGTNDPSASFLRSLIKDFGVDANWLLLGTDGPAAPQLTSRETTLLANYRKCSEDAQQILETTSALLTQCEKKTDDAGC